MNKREEDYIKTIYSLTIEKDKKLAKAQAVANLLNVTIQTANEMFKKLNNLDLLVYLPYKGVYLTNKGKIEAIRVIRAHRVLELFLTKTLNFNWSEVHEDAEKLEHAASEKVINALYEFLGRPEKDPHGHVIPTPGIEYKISNLHLFKLKKDQRFKIIRINESDELFNFFNKNKIKIYDEFIVIDKNIEEKVIKIKNTKTYSIKEEVSKNIFVEIIEKW